MLSILADSQTNVEFIFYDIRLKSCFLRLTSCTTPSKFNRAAYVGSSLKAPLSERNFRYHAMAGSPFPQKELFRNVTAKSSRRAISLWVASDALRKSSIFNMSRPTC
jgi:hypothetical protein